MKILSISALIGLTLLSGVALANPSTFSSSTVTVMPSPSATHSSAVKSTQVAWRGGYRGYRVGYGYRGYRGGYYRRGFYGYRGYRYGRCVWVRPCPGCVAR